MEENLRKIVKIYNPFVVMIFFLYFLYFLSRQVSPSKCGHNTKPNFSFNPSNQDITILISKEESPNIKQ